MLFTKEYITNIRCYYSAFDVPNLSSRYDPTVPISASEAMKVVGGVLDNCNSDAYIFVNQPGLMRTDFFYYSEQFVSLKNYVKYSSSAYKFEIVDSLTQDTFDKFFAQLQENCKIDNIIRIEGNKTEDYEPYLDTEKRIILIDFPELSTDRNLRFEAITSYDKFLRFIIAQIPSPSHSVFYTSLKPGKLSNIDSVIPVEIFDDIFNNKYHKGGMEKNNRIFEVPPTVNTHRPKFAGISSQYVTIFDSKFLEENEELLRIIITVFIGYILYEVISVLTSIRGKKEPNEKGDLFSKNTKMNSKDRDKGKSVKTKKVDTEGNEIENANNKEY